LMVSPTSGVNSDGNGLRCSLRVIAHVSHAVVAEGTAYCGLAPGHPIPNSCGASILSERGPSCCFVAFGVLSEQLVWWDGQATQGGARGPVGLRTYSPDRNDGGMASLRSKSLA